MAGGLAENLDVDPSIIRIVWALLIFLTGGIALLVYIVMAIVVPERPEGMPIQPWTASGGAPTTPAGTGTTGTTGTTEGASTPSDPVPEGAWRAPDGSTVPLAAGPATPGSRRRRDPADRTTIAVLAGLLLIVLGGWFLIRRFLPDVDLWFWWPLLAVVAGIVLLVVALLPPRRR